jgi:hypothetical protein
LGIDVIQASIFVFFLGKFKEKKTQNYYEFIESEMMNFLLPIFHLFPLKIRFVNSNEMATETSFCGLPEQKD